MRTILFRTPGLASLEALTTLGVSVKETSNPIGFFGTGFKYALAWCLRNGHEVSVHWSNRTTCRFSTQEKLIRGQTVKLILADGVPLGFTTALGPTWEAWQAYRELHSNTLDESGEILEGRPEGAWTGRPQETIIQVSGDEFARAYDERGKIFLAPANLLESNSLGAVYSGSSKHRFYRGVRAGDLPQTSLLTWNRTSETKLTEDRTIEIGRAHV